LFSHIFLHIYLDIYEDNTSHVNQIISHEKSPVSSVHRPRHDSESLTSTHEYISLHNNQQSNTKTTTSRVKNRNYHEEFHSLDHSINPDKSLISHQQGGSNFQDNIERKSLDLAIYNHHKHLWFQMIMKFRQLPLNTNSPMIIIQ
jgi:hypothetical protein